MPEVLVAQTEFDLDVSIENYCFKSSHNSYEPPLVISELVEDLNIWCLELDLCGYYEDGFIKVEHCGKDKGSDETGYARADFYLRDILESISELRGIDERFIILFFDIKMGGLNPWDGDDQQERMASIRWELGTYLAWETTFYSCDEWMADNQVWPSINQLVAAGKKYICFYDENDGNDYDEFFFITAQSKAEAQLRDYVALVNIGDGDTSGGNTPSASDGWLWRGYYLNDEQKYRDAAAAGFNILATDEIYAVWSYDWPVHPPVPTYLNAKAPCYDIPSVCASTLGTLGLPFAAIEDGGNCTSHCPALLTDHALDWPLPRNSKVILAGGDYPGVFTIDKPVVLSHGESGLVSDPGPARLGAGTIKH